MNKKSNLIFYYSIVVISLLIGIISAHRLLLKPDLPIQYKIVDKKVVSENNFNSIDSNSIIETFSNVELYSLFQLEFLLDSKSIGEQITLRTLHKGVRKQSEITLVPYYDLPFIIISLVIGIAFILSGLFVITKKPYDYNAKILFRILLLFALASFTSPGKFYTGTDIPGIIIRLTHSLSYIFGIAAFLHFSFVFPLKKIRSNLLETAIYTPSLILVLFVSTVMVVSMLSFGINYIEFYEIFWTVIQSLLALSIIFGVFNFYISSRNLSLKEDKHKIKWILWGIAAGVFPYLILFVIPTVLGFHILIPEEYSMIPLMLIPVSFAFAVVKYHIFDIEIIINRSIVYSILTGFIVLFYFAIVVAGTSLLHQYAGNVDRFTSLIAVFIIAFFLNPVRIRIQKFVNRSFYREKYDFELALKSFSKTVSECSTLGQFAKRTLKEIQALIPVDKGGLFSTNEDNSRLRVLAQNNMDNAVKNLNALRVKQIKSDFNKPFALQDNIQQGIEIDTSLTGILQRWDLCLIIPLKLHTDAVIGGIVLGKKLSGIKYSQHDIDLLGVIASELAVALKRLQLQEELIAKELENQKLEELNTLKSFFVSSVTHDLKTPLTSIRMFAELLRTMDSSSTEKNKEYLSIIEGESDRLSQLIDNVLMYSKIENGVQQYSFECYDLNKLAEEVMDFMNYQFKINNFEVITCLYNQKLLIPADKSAVQSVLVNLLSNAIKYSNNIKIIKLTTDRIKEFAFVSVEEYGIGIPESDLPNIFEPFFRSESQGMSKTNGTGLGLAIVKHIMDYHKGKIEVTSVIGKGSTFKLLFPFIDKQSNIENI